MSAMVPIRILWSNWINGLATIRAVGKYASARFRGHALAWTKTSHQYPTRAALAGYALKLGEILVQNRVVERHVVEQAMAQKGEQRLGEYLLLIHAITEGQLYEALALQQQLPLVAPGPLSIPSKIARALPIHLVRDWKVIPFAIDEHGVQLCTPDAPPAELPELLRRYTGMAVRFHLIPATRFDALAHQVLNWRAVKPQLTLAAGSTES